MIRTVFSIFLGSAFLLQGWCQQPAFPGAEGFGAYSKGGRGGTVWFVTNLEDQGPGSLRWAVEQEGPRTVIFLVSGNIELEKQLEIEHPYITIAGQTAPGDGICIKGGTLLIRTHDVTVRYIRVRLGDATHGQGSLQGKSRGPGGPKGRYRTVPADLNGDPAPKPPDHFVSGYPSSRVL